MAFRRLGGSTLTGKKYNSTAVDAQYFSVTGGTLNNLGKSRVYTFTSDGTLAITAATKATGFARYADSARNIDYLVVAGGAAGGGRYYAGGGGSGGARCTVDATGGGGALETSLPFNAQSFTVTIGGGGAGASGYLSVNGVAGGSGIVIVRYLA